MSSVAERIAGLDPEKRKMLARLLAGQKSRRPENGTIPVRPDPAHYPLSFSQERLWFLEHLLPGSGLYNMAGVARVRGPLDETAVFQTFNEIVRRHEVLRTVFRSEDGRPQPVLLPELTLPADLVELRHLAAPAQREAEARRLIAEIVRRPFDLAHGPLIRFVLIRLAPDDHLGLLCTHHIVSDGVSTQVLFHEFAHIYPAFARGAAHALLPLPVQYADYALWQREQIQGAVLAEQLAYWKQQFHNGIPVLELPADRPRPAVPTHRGARHAFTVPASLTRQLKQFSRQEGVTLFMTLLAAFKTLLHRYTSEPEVVVGVPIAGRNRPEVAGLIGCFLNMLALRTDFSGNPTFRDLLHQVKKAALGAYAHQDLPFERLVDELQPKRTLSQAPLFQVAFSFEEDPAVTLQVDELAFHFEEVDTGSAKLDLALELTEVGLGAGESELQGWFEYSADLFEPETVARTAARFVTLLAGIVAWPGQEVWQLPLLPEAEKHLLLETWNDTAVDYPMDACLHELFEGQVTRTPDNPAVFCGDRHLTYSELNERANRLAHYLQALGVGPESLVGLCLERSLDMIVAVLATLKAGGAYVPIDAGHPESRLEFMLADTRGTVLLTQQKLADRLPRQPGVTLVCLDSDWPEIARQSGANTWSSAGADNLAYVLYTSGSTGQPKGVTVPHRDIVHHTLAFIDVQKLTPADRMLMFVSLLFDAAAAALYPPLLCGASVVLPETASSELSSQDTLQLCLRHGVTVVHQPDSYWHQWVDDLAATGQGFDTPLRIMMTGGEVPNISKLQRWTRMLRRPVTFFNAYGPTEAVITVTLFQVECTPEVVGSLTRMPAGRPIANKRLYLLDPYLQPVPIGVPGEIYVGGIGLARDYLNQPERTAEKFVRDPFSSRPGARLYRTGDLGRYLPDGNLEFITRADEQLKIRGYRIEPGEVEKALTQHPEILESLVTGWTDPAGRRRLVAYLVARSQPAPSPGLLRDFLKQYLPDYMLPGAFVFLQRIPLTVLGKADRQALPPPTWERVEETAFAPPATPQEEILASIWRGALNVERIGIHDNFFDLGGDSILSMQIVARANQAGLRLTPRQIFQYQTIAELAAVVDSAPQIQAEQGLVSGPAPLLPIQRWFFEQNLAEPHHWNQAIWLEARQPLDAARLQEALNLLLHHHDALRLRFRREEGEWRQFMGDRPEPVPLTRVNLSSLPPTEQESCLEREAATLQAGLDLEMGPLFRAALFDRGPGRPARLLLIGHHLVVDGVSWRILVEDLQTLYESGAAGALPAKTSSFPQWANRLESYARENQAQLEAALTHWLGQSRGRANSLPLDMTAGENCEGSAVTLTRSLSARATEELLHVVPAAYHTAVNDLLLAALTQLLAHWSSANTVAVQLEGHGRSDFYDDIDLSRTAGWYTTAYPALLSLPTQDPGELLKSIKEQLRHTPHDQTYGLLRYLCRSDVWRPAPTPEVSFNYLGQVDQGGAGIALFTLAPEMPGCLRSPLGLRPYLLDVNCFIAQERLHVSWTYSRRRHHAATMEALIDCYLNAVRKLIVHCCGVEQSHYTPSDFPDVALDQAELDAVLAEIDLP
jgi:fengycin family lipopeptide synthetase B